MTDIPESEHVMLGTHLARVLTAHEAVAQGIATHAEKETARRDQARRQLEAQVKLQAGTSGSH